LRRPVSPASHRPSSARGLFPPARPVPALTVTRCRYHAGPTWRRKPARSPRRPSPRVAPRPTRQRASAPLLSLQPGPACQLLLPRSATPAPKSRRDRRDSLPCSHAEIPGLPPLNRPNPLRPLPIQQSAAPRTLAPPPSRSARSAAQSPQRRRGHATPLRHPLRQTPQEHRRSAVKLFEPSAPVLGPRISGIVVAPRRR